MNENNITDVIPNVNDFWEEIGGHFDSFTQVVAEFIDNSLSAIIKNKRINKTVVIKLEERNNDKVFCSIEDGAGGIENLKESLTIGEKSVKQTPLNEHGFGLKHALAAANPENDNWKIYTRTEEHVDKNTYLVIEAPYSFKEIKCKSYSNKKWPGEYNCAGTKIEFECERSFFDTVQRGIRGRAEFDRCVNYLAEELGYIYAGVIEKGTFTIKIKAGSSIDIDVKPVQPEYEGFYNPKPDEKDLDLGGGTVKIKYKFGEIRESNYKKFYKKNISTSGVEIRVNGRLLESKLFSEIWKKERHPLYNHFLAQIDIISDNSDALPKTRTSKNGIRTGDKKLEKLFEWIQKVLPEPPTKLSKQTQEKEFMEELKTIKEKHIPAKDKVVSTEHHLYKTLNGSSVVADLYVYDGTNMIIYEAKRDKGDIKSLYQLLMYWDGAVYDGQKPTKAILLASSFVDGLDTLVAQFNNKKDENGNNYNFELKTWKDEGINYPN